MKGNIILSEMLVRYGEKEQKYAQESKYMTCHLVNLMLYCYYYYFFFY